MTTVLLLIISLTSYTMLRVRHPVRMAGLLIVIALITSIFLGKLIVSWIIYLLALVFLGGVIVVLLFMVSVCANEKFFYYSKKRLGPVILLTLILSIPLRKTTLLREGLSGIRVPLVLYQSEGAFGFVLFISILVLCMLRVVKISKLESGPLVKRL